MWRCSNPHAAQCPGLEHYNHTVPQPLSQTTEYDANSKSPDHTAQTGADIWLRAGLQARHEPNLLQRLPIILSSNSSNTCLFFFLNCLFSPFYASSLLQKKIRYIGQYSEYTHYKTPHTRGSKPDGWLLMKHEAWRTSVSTLPTNDAPMRHGLSIRQWEFIRGI